VKRQKAEQSSQALREQGEVHSSLAKADGARRAAADSKKGPSRSVFTAHCRGRWKYLNDLLL